MPYFSYFPSISYVTDPTDLTKIILVKDITIRAKISDYFKNSAITSLPYTIQDGERPETLSYRIYDRVDLYWTILLFNEIHDPTFEWPLSSAELESKLQKKYKGYALYYPDSARIPDTFQLQDTTVFKGASTVSQVLADGTVITANIIKWDPTYNSIVIDGDQASLFDPTLDSPLSTDQYARLYVDGDPSKLFAFSKIVPYEYAVHHFEDTDGNILDPRSGPPNDPTNPSSILNRYVSDVDFIETLAVDNRTQEYITNENKRSIRVVKPEYMNAIVTQFRGLFV
jgi:Base plate wedge protein 53